MSTEPTKPPGLKPAPPPPYEYVPAPSLWLLSILGCALIGVGIFAVYQMLLTIVRLSELM